MNEFELIKKYFQKISNNNPSAKKLSDDVFFDLSALSIACFLFKQVKIPFPMGFLFSIDNFINALIVELHI